MKLKSHIILFLSLLSLSYAGLITPSNGSDLSYVHVLFEWDQEPNTDYYQLQISNSITSKIPVVRAMPNTAISIQESMTCLSSNNKEALENAQNIFNTVGKTLIIDEEQMVPATALCACGIAFFLRAIFSFSPISFPRLNFKI